jgi:hypothetical protein
MRFALFVLTTIVFTLVFLYDEYYKTETAQRQAVIFDVANYDNHYQKAYVDYGGLLSDKAVESFIKNRIVTLFNYRVGDYESHTKKSGIKSFFCTNDDYNRFYSQFASWSLFEFKRNNISIKEMVITRSNIYKNDSNHLGLGRVWRFNSDLIFFNRGVGGSDIEKMKTTVTMAYTPLIGDLCIKKIKLYY